MPVFAVLTAKGPAWDHRQGIRDQPYWDEHAAFADRLTADGVIIFGGPVGIADQDVIALLAVRAADEQELHTLFAADPWLAHGVFRLRDVWPWTIWLDGPGIAAEGPGRRGE
jgi:uncharacterized protein YciI